MYAIKPRTPSPEITPFRLLSDDFYDGKNSPAKEYLLSIWRKKIARFRSKIEPGERGKVFNQTEGQKRLNL